MGSPHAGDVLLEKGLLFEAQCKTTKWEGRAFVKAYV
jgi:hypothetical protein